MFSCFSTHIHSNKLKKSAEHSVEAVQETLKVTNVSLCYKATNAQIEDMDRSVGLIALDHRWKSAEMKGKVNFNHNTETHQASHLKKSQSLGSLFCMDGRLVMEHDGDDKAEQRFPSDSPDQVSRIDNKRAEGNLSSQCPGVRSSVSAKLCLDHGDNGSIFPPGNPHLFAKCLRNSDSSSSRHHHNHNHTPYNSPLVVKSRSTPNVLDAFFFENPCSSKYSGLQVRSFDDLQVLFLHQKEDSVHKGDIKLRQDQNQDDGIYKSENNNAENFVDYSCKSDYYSSLSKDWIIPVTEERNWVKPLRRDSSAPQLDKLHNKDFMIKRIEEWVNDLQHCSMLEDADVLSDYDDRQEREPALSNGSTAAKADVKETPGMEAAKKYISSLSASATAAQLANHGLALIPFLSAFVGLRVLNLSGNAIVRITAGALPRGLHMLNLSKNSISSIEGLRELTRLRTLDLSYNRILRIGHGLASCSSLKQLYLAGNKIGEVEGLHRLLKLAVLDLRFNKISTTKCLGQLAANYNSLQAVSLEGNPAQKNVGDEQLKKYLLGLLPHLAYFNRLPIRSSSLKDVADRSLRMSSGTHQLDRSLRSELKGTRKSNHGAAAPKSSSFAALHSRKGHATGSLKRSQERQGDLPPTGMRASTFQRSRYFDNSSKLSSVRSELSMQRSRSEGTLGPF